MVKKKRKAKGKDYLLHLVCKECGHKFTSERFKKYCCYSCQRIANAGLQKIRYAEMRDLFLKARGDIKQQRR